MDNCDYSVAFVTENVFILVASDWYVSHGQSSEYSCILLAILVLIKIYKLKSELAEKCSFRCWEREWGTIWYLVHSLAESLD